MKKKKFVKFYDQFASRIYRFIYLKVSSPQDSEDLTSEAFLKFWDNLTNKNKKEKINNPRALLYRIANNLVIDHYRKKSRTEIISDPTEDAVLINIPDKSDLSQKMSLDSDMEQVRKALSQLKDEYQNIIIWHYLDDFSAKEIAQILEKPENNIRVLIHRALKELKKRV